MITWIKKKYRSSYNKNLAQTNQHSKIASGM